MADIFVSYARADKARVTPLVAALEAQGWTVWWDREITPGQEFDQRISAELEVAKAVIVVWSPLSVDSRWVRGEAREAADRGVLVPVRFERARLPIDVRAIHTTDLDDWKDDAQGAAFQELRRALGALLRTSNDAAADAPTPGTESERKGFSICVLPFANMSDDAQQEYFSDGISEDIITDLSKVSALTVISRNSAFTFKGKHVDLPQVARQLKVSHVLEGSVRKSGNRVRITAQLIDGATNGHVWAERYDRDLADIFALQDEISQAIVAALKLKLFPEEKKAIEDRGTNNIDAYDFYLKAQAAMRENSGEAYARAVDFYRQAIAIEPEFVAAWIGLAGATLGILAFSANPPPAARSDMMNAIERALSLAPNEAESLMLQARKAMALDRDAITAGRAVAKLMAIPSDRWQRAAGPGFDQTGYGQILANFGYTGKAIEIFKATIGSDPLSLAASSQLQYNLSIAGRYEEAEAEYQRTKHLPGDHAPWEFERLARLWVQGAAPAMARAQFERVVSTSTGFFPLHKELLAVCDDTQGALAVLRRAFDEPFYQRTPRLNILALYGAHYGDHEFAYAALHRAFVEQHHSLFVNLWHSLYAGLRRETRFKEVVRRTGLVGHWRESGKWGDFARPLGDDDFEIVR